MLRVGLMDPVMAARPSADTFSRMSYLSAAASRVDSYWVPDHINGVTPRPSVGSQVHGLRTAAALTRRGDGSLDAAGQPGRA